MPGDRKFVWLLTPFRGLVHRAGGGDTLSLFDAAPNQSLKMTSYDEKTFHQSSFMYRAVLH